MVLGNVKDHTHINVSFAQEAWRLISTSPVKEQSQCRLQKQANKNGGTDRVYDTGLKGSLHTPGGFS